MKANIATSSLNGKEDIWWEYVKHVIGIREEKLIWDEFETLFREKYMSERYYDGKVKKFYELRMRSMTDEEYTTKFLELLTYAPYLKGEKVNIHSFIVGFLVAFKDQIYFDKPQSLEESIKNLKHCYEQSKCNIELIVKSLYNQKPNGSKAVKPSRGEKDWPRCRHQRDLAEEKVDILETNDMTEDVKRGEILSYRDTMTGDGQNS